MDFASALADLEKTAAAAASSNTQQSSSTSSASASQEQRPDYKRRGRPGPHHPHDSYQRRSQRPRYNDHHHHHHRSPLDAMIRFGYRVQPYRPPPPADSDKRLEEGSRRRPFHIALLCLSIDDLPYETVWKAWSETGGNTTTNNATLVSLICHAKFPSKVTSPWLKQRLLTKPPRLGRGNSYADPEYLSYQPEWGSIQITRAMIRTLIEGMKIGGGVVGTNDDAADAGGCEDARFSTRRFLINKETDDKQQTPTQTPTRTDHIPPVDTFIFISETCLPVRTLAECEQLIYGDEEDVIKNDTNTMDDNDNNNSAATTSVPRQDVSWIHARNRNTPGTPQNKYERDQFLDIHRMIPQHYRWKSDQWLLLSRPHATAVLDIDKRMRPSDQLWNSFAKVSASDEMYFATAMAVLGILKEQDQQGDNNNIPEQIANRRITYVDWSEGMRNPASFGRGLRDLNKVGRLARAQGCLFARKFVPVLPGQETVTGEISVDEWKNAIEQMAQAEADAKADQDGTNNTQHELESSKAKAEQGKTEEAQQELETKTKEDLDETNELQE